MSLILEALRKSEAERRRGDGPALATELPPPRSAQRVERPSALPWLAGAGLLALAAGMAWWHASRTAPTPPGPAARAEPASRSAQASTLPKLATVPPPARSASKPALPVATPPAIVRRAPPRTVAPAPPAPIADTSASPPPTSRTLPAPPRQAPPAMPPPSGTPVALGNLDTQTRRALPPLKLSMHMWNDDPAQRFVILDGQRLREGDMAGPAVLTRIVPDGVILDFDGRSIRVPLR